MDPVAALADLTEISSQVEAAVLLDGDGTLLASTFAANAGARRLADAAASLVEAAAETPLGAGRELTQLEVALPEGSVFVVREGGRTVAATTLPGPTSGLVLYDLRACLRTLDPPPKPRARRPRKRRAAAETKGEAADA